MGERIIWQRVPGLPGVEMLFLEDTDRRWRVVHNEFGIGASTGWFGEVFCRGRRSEMSPGASLCIVPGEVHTSPVTTRPGGFHTLLIQPATFDAYMAEHDIAPGRAAWTHAVSRLSPALLQRLDTVMRVATSAHTAMEAQVRMIDLLALAASELIETRPALRPVGARAAERIRECLHSDEGASLSLDEVASAVGLNRYQVVRTFTARFGLAPHAYQICRKIAQARVFLREGRSATEVAALCGFADQSHFGRHFKRFTGLTPGSFARPVRR